MASEASGTEKATRAISPLVFVAAIVGFFFAFAGVSCNISAAKTLLGGAAQSLGGSSDQTAKASACLDALNGYNLATYSGINLAFGGTPSVASKGPAACEAVNPSSSSSASTTSDQAKIGLQPLELIGLIAAALGVLVSIVFLLRAPASRLRAAITLLVAVVALVLVVVAQLQVGKVITDRIASASSGQTSQLPNLNLSDYLNVNPGIGFFITVVALGLAVLVNLFAAAAPGRSRAEGAAPVTPTGQGPGLGPPLQPAWPGAPGAEPTPPGSPPPPPPHASG